MSSNADPLFTSSVTEAWDGRSNQAAPKKEQALTYPASLMNLDQNEDRPVIFFESSTTRPGIGQGTRTRIFLPIPAGLTVSDSASYGDVDLDIVGSAAAAGVKTAQNSNAGFWGTAGAITKEAFDSVKGDVGGIVGQIVSKQIGGTAGDGISIAMGTTLNKNVTTDFQGIGTRAYSYTFKLVPGSEKEAETIRQICSAFRLGLYPEGNRAILRYPPKWQIRFLEGATSRRDITNIPKIFECFLTEFSSVYNSTANGWHQDGAPVETDITIAFKETRALTAADIAQLEHHAFDDTKFPGGNSIPLERGISTPPSGVGEGPRRYYDTVGDRALT